MSGQLESALVIELVDAIKWGAALEPTAADGSLTSVDLSKPIDITKYSRRDRELGFRDLINATAVVKVALHTETVWNAEAVKPKLQGITGDDLPATVGDIGAADSTVVHVKNSSLPKDALATDKDLAGRDAMIYEVLAKACEVFEEPPIMSPGTGVVGTTAWSLAEGVDYNVQPNPALPLDKNAFYLSDATLAQRDNFVAAYAAKIVDILHNPFAFANRLYVRIDGVDARDAEVYSLVRNYYVAGETYDVGEEVFYLTNWYRALNPTTDQPTSTSDWVSIAAPRRREWSAEPAIQFRNRIVYDTVAKTLQWFRETTDTTHIPQLYAMSIPGLFVGQTINTLAQVPERKDCQFWRQKAARIDYSGTTSALASVYQDTTVIGGGVHMSDTIGLTAPGSFEIPLGVPVYLGHKYRLSALVKPTQVVDIDGNRNLLGLSGDGDGIAFTGAYKPTTTSPGQAVTFSLDLPAGAWYVSIEYTNLSGTTSGFGLRVAIDDTIIADDTVSLLFQDDAGITLEAGTPVQSTEWRLTSDGTSGILSFIWTYGSGNFQVNKISVRTSDRFEAEYFIKAEIHDNAGNDVYFGDAPTVESTGRKNIYEVLNWDFTVISDSATPYANITWMSSSDLPIQFRKISLSEIVPTFATPGITGFDSFKWECLRRAERSVQAAFIDDIRTTTGTIADFTSDGTVWNNGSTESWMSQIEIREPRLRYLQGVASVRDGYQYQVLNDGYVVYNSGTYSENEIFNGTNVGTFVAYGTNTDVSQVGAFRKSAPIDVGHPAIMPLGLRFDEINSLIRMDSEPSDRVPTVVACQPWMIEAGLYVAEDDFRSSDTAASAPDTVTISVSPDPAEGGTVFGAGRYDIFDSVLLVATPSPGGSTTTPVDWGVDIAVALDMSGSLNPAAPFVTNMLASVNTLLTAAGVGTGAVTNNYAWVKWAGNFSAGSVHQNFTSYAAWASNVPTGFAASNEDGYVGINTSLTGLSWRTTGNVVRIIVLITDEDRNNMIYVTGGGTSALQYAAILNELNTTLSSGPVKLISVIQARLLDANSNYILGYKYGGTGYMADGAGGYTTVTGGHSYNLSGYKLPNGSNSRYEYTGPFGGDNLTSTPARGGADADVLLGAWDEYGRLAEDPTIQGQVWDFYHVRSGGVNATSLSKAMTAALVEDITFQITENYDWSFVGWYDQSGNLLSASTTYAFTATSNQTITGRFVQV
ncbi:MAG: hypothetical protein ACOYB3_00095 [Azonexus sp.]